MSSVLVMELGGPARCARELVSVPAFCCARPFPPRRRRATTSGLVVAIKRALMTTSLQLLVAGIASKKGCDTNFLSCAAEVLVVD